MPIGTPASPVASDVPINNPTPRVDVDHIKDLDARLKVLERVGT